jgi:hypothetical protein
VGEVVVVVWLCLWGWYPTASSRRYTNKEYRSKCLPGSGAVCVTIVVVDDLWQQAVGAALQNVKDVSASKTKVPIHLCIVVCFWVVWQFGSSLMPNPFYLVADEADP